MTKEEAVKWLKTTMDNYDFFPETKEVLKLAVEALEFELNCECCMWREKAEEDTGMVTDDGIIIDDPTEIGA